MSMNKLPTIIGLAPSEMDFKALLELLSVERERVRGNLIAFAANIPKPKAKAKPRAKGGGGKPPTRLTTKLKNAGVSLDQFEAELKRIAKEKGIEL